MLTNTSLQSIMPALPAKRRDEFLPFLQSAIEEFEIDRPARTAAFLAQLAHESGQFRFMEEIWGPTDAQRRYEPSSTLATRLGNNQPGDGKRFKGRGPIQITGRANYDRFGKLLDVDLVAAPERAAVPDLAFRIAGLFWSKKGLNELADRATPEAFREITRRINGGFNGLADREKFYAAACSALGVTPPPVSRGGERELPGEESAEPTFDRGWDAVREVDDKPARGKAAAARRRPRTGARAAESGVRRSRGGRSSTARGAKRAAGPKRRAAAKSTARRTTKSAAKRSTKSAARKAAARRGPKRR